MMFLDSIIQVGVTLTIFNGRFLPTMYQTISDAVNPQAVNEPGFDVFTANTRSILYLTHERTGMQVAFVAIGALLVGSIKWTGGGEKGKAIKRGDELG
jgi:phosphatidylserine decarboxylase